MNNMPILLCDFYKISHREQYPEGTEEIYSTWTPRSAKHYGTCDYVVNFGLQAFIKKYLINYFNENFFERKKSEVLAEYKRFIKHTLGIVDPYTKHIEALWDLQYLPIEINALREGTVVPMRVPMMTIKNTKPEFFWVTNFLETLLSSELWLPTTSATIALEYRTLLDKWCEETGGDPELVQFQAHDFSMRGLSSLESAAKSAAGHLLSFTGTDSIPGILHLEEYYNANIEEELVGCSIPATEHSVMCAGGKGSEYETYKRLITETYPEGFISIVSDTWDLWNTLTYIIPQLKNDILVRDGKVVIRPDSGDPVDIICGSVSSSNSSAKYKDEYSPEDKGVIQLLWDIFGGTVNEKGYKILDPHIGAIYGDSITIERADEICKRLANRGFASTNIVFGVGSYTYQYQTRDTFGFAMKSTFARINGVNHLIFKDPVTDDGVKKSQKGKVRVFYEDSVLKYEDGLYTEPEQESTLLKVVFRDGALLRNESLSDIRAYLHR